MTKQRLVILRQWWQTYDTCIKGDTPQHFGWHTSIHNTQQQLFSKAHPVLAWFGCVWRLQKNGVCFCRASGASENNARMGHAFVCFSEIAEVAFFKATSRMKASCNLELHWLGCRGLSTEREQHLNISSMWIQTACGRSLGLQGNLFEWQRWC